MSLPLLYPVFTPGGFATDLKGIIGAAEHTADLFEGTVIFLVGPLEHLLQTGGDFLQRQPLTLFTIGGLLIDGKQHLT